MIGEAQFRNITPSNARRSWREDGQCCSDIVRCFPDAVRTSRTNWPCIELYLRFSRSNSIFALSSLRPSLIVPIVARIATLAACGGTAFMSANPIAAPMAISIPFRFHVFDAHHAGAPVRACRYAFARTAGMTGRCNSGYCNC